MPQIDLTAIDPSINHIAISHLESGEITSAKTIHTKTKGDDRYAEIARKMTEELSKLPPQPVVIEYPDSWHRSNVKDLLKLSTAIGCIHGVATLCGHEVYLVGVREWKGSGSKVQTARELKIMGYDPTVLKWNEHERDAARLALWAEGWLRVKRRATR